MRTGYQMIPGEFVERKLEVGNSCSGMNSGKFASWVPLFNLIFLLRLSQSFSNCCFFFCLLSPFLPALSPFCLAWVRIKSRLELCTRITRPHTQVLFVQCNKFTKFLDKKVFLCSSDFLFSPFILRRSFFLFFVCLRCAGILALAHSSIRQPIIILKHSTSALI